MYKAIISVILFAAVLTGCGTDRPPGGGLLISSNQTGNWEVFIFYPQSSMVHQVTHEGPWVPEDQASGAIVEGNDFEAAWSPDGKQIALVSDRSSQTKLYIVDTAGAEITEFAELSVGEPAWSPDGSQIAFRADLDGDVDLYLADVDGSNVRQLTRSPGEDWTPAWSPDGTLLAFSSRRGNGTWDLFTMRPDGSEITQLTNDPWDNYLPDWSPDGTQIAFAGNRSGNWDIYTMGLDGNSVRQLSNHEKNDIEPVWSPDGTLLAFASARTTTVVGWEIFFVDVESGEVSGSGKAGYPTDWFSEIEDSG